MAADRESPRGSLGYVHDNSTDAAPIDDDGVPAGPGLIREKWRIDPFTPPNKQ